MPTQSLETHWSVNWGDIFLGHVFIGFIIGVFAAGAFERWAEGRRWRKLRMEADIEGRYIAYLFARPNDTLNYANPSGTDAVTYVKENVYRLTHTETGGRNVWEGTIYMDTPGSGQMIWKYVMLDGNAPPREHRFGFKRCVISAGFGQHGEQRRYLYLLGEPPFGREVLEKQS